ncbi:MDR family NADP-dependent oxidoreductase [Aspergillus affinis]|uniref:MDR family NADP-dependent oxidoreductase n=1 Tax=Aspergillus affinis TaxID=1070780 RepID=UPI0022FE8D52|nr:uncharacterized protein KD926_000253 [Aspergillus affinis]KAI9037533.1 hypothetical protein KD926_000253 [Aspergillus affinis]
MSNKALVFKKVPQGYPVPGEHIVIEPASYDASTPAPEGGVVLHSLYASFDPYMRFRMRPEEVKSHAPAFSLNQPIDSASIAKVIRSKNTNYKEGDIVTGHMPIQEYVALGAEQTANIKPLDNPLGIEDVRVFLGALGMPGLTAYSSLYEIGKPKKGETIFHEGLKVIGSVGSDEKLEYITKDLGFDGGFNYKKEAPKNALARLAPQGIDIYYENVGGVHLEAALDALNNFGRVVVCGLISQYNSEPYPIKNILNVFTKRLDIRGFFSGDQGMGDKYAVEHQKNMQKWIKEGSFKTLTHETAGIDNAADGLAGIFHGKNMGKAVLKF